MTSKYYVKARYYADCEGKSVAFVEYGEKVDTIEKAKEIAKTIKAGMYYTGHYYIVKRTIDEKTFTVTDEEIFYFDYDKEIRQYENAERDLVFFTKRIEEIKIKMRRYTSEKSIAKANQDIKDCEKRVLKAKEILKKN